MPGFFSKKTQAQMDLEYANAIAEFNTQCNSFIPPEPLVGLLNESEEDLPTDVQESNSLTPLIQNTAKFTQQELSKLLEKIETRVKNNPAEKPLMTKALTSLAKTVNNPSPENLKELMWTALAVSRKGDALSGISASMTGIGFSLFITSLIVGATVATAAAAFPIMAGVAVGLMLTGAIIFVTGVDHILLSENSAIAKEIKGIRATLSGKNHG
jgi:hypothetical protein